MKYQNHTLKKLMREYTLAQTYEKNFIPVTTLKNVSEVCGNESTMGSIPSQHVYQIKN